MGQEDIQGPQPLQRAQKQRVAVDDLFSNLDLSTSLADLLLAAQAVCEGWLSPEVLNRLATLSKRTPSEILRRALEIPGLHLEPPARHRLKICEGPHCTIAMNDRGNLTDYVSARFQVEPGELTPDGQIYFDHVYCLGWCDYAPAIVIDGKIKAEVDPDQLGLYLDKLD